MMQARCRVARSARVYTLALQYRVARLRSYAGSYLYIASFAPSTDRVLSVHAARPLPGLGATDCQTPAVASKFLLLYRWTAFTCDPGERTWQGELYSLYPANRSSDANSYRP